MLDTSADLIEARVDDGPWRVVEITWEEGVHKVARLLLDEPGQKLELRANAPWTFGTIEFYEQIAAGDVLTRDLPFAEPDVQSHINAIAPADLVISRTQWGARNPGKVCGTAHTPQRMSIHHTAVPADDGGDAAARMRSMQAYHIDSNGWCDIGYHFVVSQAGRIYQGISNEQRTGAHTYAHNTNNVGICFIGDFNAQSVGTAQRDAGAAIIGWVGRTYNIPFNRTSIKGHREHSSNSTSCPGNNLLNILQSIIDQAKTPTPTEPVAAAFEVNWLGETTDLYTAGSSAGKPDFFEGDTLQAEIKFKNTLPGPARNVQLSYWFEAPHLAATNYQIQSDAPSFNGSTFGVNDADAHPDNPGRTEMGASGTLNLYAMASGETKRIVVDLVAGEYSIGLADHPDVRGWVKHIDGSYGEQTAWNQDPSNANAFEGLLQSFAQLDVLSQKEWQFDAGEPEQHEGWSECNGGPITVDVEAGALSAELGANGCLDSPVWTEIDAAKWDQLVMRVDVPADLEASLYWTREGEEFSEDRAVSFRLAAGANTYVIDLGGQASWSDTISQLRFVPGTTTIKIDAVFVQSAAGEVGSKRETWVDLPPVEFGGTVDPPPAGANNNIGGDNNTGGNTGGDNTGGEVTDDTHYDQTEFRTKNGCATATSLDGRTSITPLFMLLGLFMIRRRQR